MPAARRSAGRLAIGALVASSALLTGGLLLRSARTVGFHYMGIAITTTWLLFTWGVLEVVWALSLTLRGIERESRPEHRLPGRRAFVAWCALVELLVLFMVPVRINLAVYRPELESVVRAVQSGAEVELPVRLGGFEVDRAALGQEGCRGAGCEVVLVLSENTDAGGELVWTRDPAHRHRGSASNGHLLGPWHWSIDE